MTRAENWDLVLRICKESKDDVIDSLRIALLNDFGKTDDFGKGDNLRQLAGCVRSFLPLRRKPVISQAPHGKPMILFPGATSSNLQNLLPVAQEARRRGLLGGVVAGENFRRLNSHALDEFEHVVSEWDLRSLIPKGFLPGSLARASRRLKKLIKHVNEYSPYCATRVRQNYGSYIRHMVASEGMKTAYQKLLSAWQPSFLLSTSDFWPAEFQCCWQARRMKIPTAILQHGVINDVCVWPTYHDTFLTWGETFRDQLLSKGFPAERVRVLGMPASDELFARANLETNEAGKATPPTCLVLSHTQDRVEESALFEEFGQCLAEAIRSTPSVKWKIRLHPAEDDSFYRNHAISKFENVEIVPRDESLEKSVRAASVVCTIRSTAGMQAMMLSRPLIVLNLSRLSGPPVSWPTEGGGVYAQNATELKNIFCKITDDKHFARHLLETQDEFLNRTFANRGKAARAMVDFLEAQTIPRIAKPSPPEPSKTF